MKYLRLMAAVVLLPAFLAGCASTSTQELPDDSDGDGVTNDLDKCPGTPRVAHPTVDAAGCPAFSDGDDVPDYLDRCPGTPAGAKVDGWGCQPPGSFAIVTNVNFEFDSAEVREEAMPKLDRVASLLRDNPKISVVVAGHTDDKGTKAYNQVLSERRAEAVKDYLVVKRVSSPRLTAEGRGESEPLVGNDTDSGRAVNRRVEFLTR